ncbi:MAG: sensor histidine kinase [Acidobacteria bacterium]|nr:sensor histidine kinase [Acidobacteriota bacterium]
MLAWHDYTTTSAWQRSSGLLLERHADEALEVLASAFSRDMRGAQASVLAVLGGAELTDDGLHEMRSDAANAFARYPYIESLFAWRRFPPSADVVFFNRAERRPRWATLRTQAAAFPVEVWDRAPFSAEFVSRLEHEAARGSRTAVFQTAIGGDVYQVIARLLYRDEVGAALNGVFGFTVNLSWVRQHYLPDMARQIAQIAGMADELTVQVRDDDGRDLVAIGGTAVTGSLKRRQLPLLFADPLRSPPGPPKTSHRSHFTIEVGIKADPGRQAAFLSARRMALFTSGAVLALGVGFLMTARAIRIEARLAELRSDFVSTVTHNLKAPITSIRILGETLARRTDHADSGVRKYGTMLVQETWQLARLVDNLLAYSRVTDVTEIYSFEPVALDQLVEKALGSFGPRLVADNFDVNVEIPDDLPDIRADSTALGLVLINLIDNAIRYSGEQKWLRITASRQSDEISIVIADHGDGIPADEMRHVHRKFYRGRRARSDGSGLGLALAERVIHDHGASWTLQSSVGQGTTVVILLPAASL